MTKSEEDLMGIFWEEKKPLTSVEILDIASDRSWNGNYLHMMLRSLQKKGLLEACGTVRYGTQYARKFLPLLTKEEYAAKIIVSTGIKSSSIAQVTVALAKEIGDKEELIEQLEEIIQELSKNGEKES
ncbi:BlaI/MecI/CopY family transcriptional regulator [Novisyntrophococcus fermenticellae]|uniref:BlaI/MecI/CopY family transcriptional regulator n=1 Tax=Novisyntrophococcus fermenticellae TaxID=2068655 RepID=UPI001E38486B|nr:BlaI/MecI/CopY family transcriptional regulator [Novisyntrophococcus fermenticellae]